MTTIILLSFISTPSSAAETKTVPVTATTSVESTKDNADLARLNEIKAMDMSTLSRSEKKDLRKEVREIKNDLDGYGRRQHHGNNGHGYNGRHSGGTVYFMGGGGLLVLILILLLI